jgi:hypothetical protein
MDLVTVPYNLSVQSKCSVAPYFDPEDGDSMFFQNVGVGWRLYFLNTRYA